MENITAPYNVNIKVLFYGENEEFLPEIYKELNKFNLVGKSNITKTGKLENGFRKNIPEYEAELSILDTFKISGEQWYEAQMRQNKRLVESGFTDETLKDLCLIPGNFLPHAPWMQDQKTEAATSLLFSTPYGWQIPALQIKEQGINLWQSTEGGAWFDYYALQKHLDETAIYFETSTEIFAFYLDEENPISVEDLKMQRDILTSIKYILKDDPDSVPLIEPIIKRSEIIKKSLDAIIEE